MTERPAGRHVDGILLLDKPVGMTSNRALQAVRHLYRAHKAGHTGSLDPLASGLLPVCLGQATKVSAWLLDSDKHYRVEARLGARTDTGDADGRVVETAAIETVTPDEIGRVLDRFRGPIEQVPPMYSALKHQGRRLYALAREGREVERKPRPVEIHRLELERCADGVMALEVECSKGTYIRSLVEDIAAAAGTLAHVTALRRLGAGPFRSPVMHTLAALETLAAAGQAALDDLLLPPDRALERWDSVHLDTLAAGRLLQGREVAVTGQRAGLVRVYRGAQVFLGVGELTADGRLSPRRLFAVSGGEDGLQRGGRAEDNDPVAVRNPDRSLFRGSPSG
jgi:tRNA pseudouridine55 synthase